MIFLTCFSKNKFPFNILALAIRHFQPVSKASHTAVLDTTNMLVYDVSFKGFRVFTYEKYLEMYYIIDRFEFEVGDVLLEARKYFNVKYSTFQLIGNICNVVFKKINPFKDGNKGLVCNEFCFLLMRDLGIVSVNEIKDIEDMDLDKTVKFLNRISKGTK